MAIAARLSHLGISPQILCKPSLTSCWLASPRAVRHKDRPLAPGDGACGQPRQPRQGSLVDVQPTTQSVRFVEVRPQDHRGRAAAMIGATTIGTTPRRLPHVCHSLNLHSVRAAAGVARDIGASTSWRHRVGAGNATEVLTMWNARPRMCGSDPRCLGEPILAATASSTSGGHTQCWSSSEVASD